MGWPIKSLAVISTAAALIYLATRRRVPKRHARLPFACSLMSHRGAAGEAVENTLPGFKRSVRMRVPMLELDVAMTL